MKRKLFLLTAMLVFALCPLIHAEDTPTLTSVDLVFSLNSSIGTADSEASLSLFDGNKTYYASAVIKSGAAEAYAHFDVDPFAPGKDFKFRVLSGFSTVKYYDYYFGQNQDIELWTYTTVTQSGSVPVSSFSFYAIPEATKPVYYFRDFQSYPLTITARYIDGVLYVPAADGAKSMGVSYIIYDENSGSIEYRVLDKSIYMSIGSRKAYMFGKEYTLEGMPTVVSGFPFIPLLSFAQMIEANVIIQDEGSHINAVVSKSAVVARELETQSKASFVNSSGLGSDTPYLIWVNKSEFKLRLYKGSKGAWELQDEFTCAIGKDSSPTCTGVFKYYSKESRWAYSSYYVGPIMRFNGGFAIHTTLLKYNGVPYDNRVGMKLSHGCVRLQPQDMYKLIETAPLYTTVYITN